MEDGRGRRATGFVAAVVLAVSMSGCLTAAPTPAPVTLPPPAATPVVIPSPAPTAGATPLPTTAPTFPLAVVTGLTSPRPGITLAELTDLAGKGSLVRPCGVDILTPALPASPP